MKRLNELQKLKSREGTRMTSGAQKKRKQSQAEYIKKHGKPEPRRKTLAVTDKYKKLKPFATGGRAGFKHGKFVSVASPHVDVAKYVDKQTGKELEPERGRSRIKGSEEKVIKKPRRSAGPRAARPSAGPSAGPRAKATRQLGRPGTGPGRARKQFGGRTNLLEEMGRLDSERMNPNRRAEKSRVMGE